MSEKIIQLPHVKEINAIIKNFNERLKFSDFLKVIDLVVDGKFSSKEALALFENAKNKGLLPFSRWDSLFQSLARIDFTQSIARKKITPPDQNHLISSDNNGPDQPTKHDEVAFQQKLEVIKASSIELDKQHKQIKNHPENPYYVFYPAVEIQNDLEAEFKGANPGQVIGSYLRAFFGDAQSHDEFRPTFACTADIHLVALVAAIIMWKMETSSQVENEDGLVTSDGRAGDITLMNLDTLCFGLWFGADVSPDSCLMQILADAPKLSQPLFVSLLWHWLFLFEKKYVKSMVLDTFIMCLPIGDSYSLHDLPKDLYGYTEEGESNARFFSERFWDASVDLGKIPFIPWPILCKLVDMRPFISIYSDPEDEETQADETQFRYYADCKINWDIGRHRRLFGCSPLDVDDLRNLCISYSHKNADLLVLLSHTASLMHDYPFGLSFLVDDEISKASTQKKSDSFRQQFEKKDKEVQKKYKKNNQSRHLQTRAKYYLQLIKQAKDEGFDELATNALSFFLFSQAGTTGRLLAPINELSPLVEQLLSKPGKEMLRHAITFASNMTRESGEMTSALILNSWVSQRQTDLKIIDPSARRPYFVPVDIPRQTASNQLLEYLGEERVYRLSEEAFQSLVEAEIQWEKLAPELGRGLKDWGTLGLALVKPIEIELVRRIGASCKSDSHAKFLKNGGKQPIGKLTLGPLLHMLKDFDRLPSDVQQSITSSGVRWHENSDLIRDLISIVNPLRNKGAHSEPFSDKDYLKLRSTLFIVSAPPTATLLPDSNYIKLATFITRRSKHENGNSILGEPCRCGQT